MKHLVMSVVGSAAIALALSVSPQAAAGPAVGGVCSPASPYPVNPVAVKHTFMSGGIERSYLVRVPSGYTGAVAKPMVIVFHGHGMTGGWQAGYDALGSKGAARDYIVVYGNGVEAPSDGKTTWNFANDPTLPDDVAYVEDLVTLLENSLCVDPQRIYIAGHSAGSAFTGYLACESARTFAGAAMVAATMQPLTCGVSRKIPTIHFQGTNDTTVPYGGGFVAGTTTPVAPVETGVRDWANQNGCTLTPVTTSIQYNLDRIRYSTCSGTMESVLYRVINGSHAWPGSILGMWNVPASNMILDFFDAH